MKKCYPLIALFALQVAAIGAPVIWDDDFSGSSLNPNFTVYRNYGDVNATQSGGLLTFSSGRGTNFAEAHVYTSTDQSGNSDIGPVYNFFERAISIKISDPVFTGGITSGMPYAMFLLVGTPDGGDPANLMPRTAFSGALARINYGAGGVWSISVGDRLIGGSAVLSDALNISGTPSSIEFILDGNRWQLALEGATFSDGGNTIAAGTFTQITASDLEAQTYFSMGIANYGDLAAGSAPYSASISNLWIGEVEPIPEPGSVVLLTAGAALLGWGLRRRKEAA